MIRSNHFIVVRGYQPKVGKKQQVRFSFYGQGIEVSSNSGIGLVNADDAKKAANDAMAVATGDFKFVSDVALGKIILKNTMDHNHDLQDRAIDVLGSGKYPIKESMKVLGEVAKEFPMLKNAVADAVSYRADQLKFLSKLAMKEDAEGLGFDDDDGLKRILQKRAIERLGGGVAPAKESRELLERVKKKFPELSDVVEKALSSLERMETRRKKGNDDEILLPYIGE